MQGIAPFTEQRPHVLEPGKHVLLMHDQGQRCRRPQRQRCGRDAGPPRKACGRVHARQRLLCQLDNRVCTGAPPLTAPWPSSQPQRQHRARHGGPCKLRPLVLSLIVIMVRLLAGDIGGTNARLELWEAPDSATKPNLEMFSLIAAKVRQRKRRRPDSRLACAGVRVQRVQGPGSAGCGILARAPGHGVCHPWLLHRRLRPGGRRGPDGNRWPSSGAGERPCSSF